MADVGGRPRTWDREDVRNKMIDWALEAESMNLNGFCARILISPHTILKWAKDDTEFGTTYALVRSILGDRREKALGEGKLHVKAYDLNATTYDAFLKAERMEMMEYETKLKSLEAMKASADDIARHDALMNQLKAIQDKKKEE